MKIAKLKYFKIKLILPSPSESFWKQRLGVEDKR